jgi:hypothetical protein
MNATQVIETADTVEIAGLILAGLLGQEGCLGGRILMPGPGKPTIRVQAFFPEMSGDLPDGMRRVFIPASIRAAMGIR